MFRVAPLLDLKHLEATFRHNVFKMMRSKGKITKDLVDMLMNRRHSGFNGFCGPRLQAGDEKAMENGSGSTASFIQISPIFTPSCVIGARETLNTSNRALHLDLHIQVPCRDHNILRSHSP